MLWGRLSALLEDQAEAFHSGIKIRDWKLLYEIEDFRRLDEVQKELYKVTEELRGKLKSLTATSQELIQLVR